MRGRSCDVRSLDRGRFVIFPSEWKMLNSQREHYGDSAVIPRISATELLGPLSPAPRRKLGKKSDTIRKSWRNIEKNGSPSTGG